MPRLRWTTILGLAALCASVSFVSAQKVADTWYPATLSGSSVAYVYVSSNPSSTKNVINGFSAASSGQLTALPGSPYTTPANGAITMALNGAWLFGTNINSDLYTWSIGANGALKLTASDDIGHVTSSVEEGPEALFLDHTGATLYVGYLNYPPDCGNPGEVAYSINQKNGKLTYVNNICVPVENAASGSGMSFIGNNKFAYTSGCYDFSPMITGVERGSNGALTLLNNSEPMPPPTSNDGYYYPCAGGAAADPTNHFALALQPFSEGIGPSPVGPFQIATYTVDSSGNVTTASTSTNMPKVAVGNVSDYWMSPDGKYLAVAGSGGLQVLHWNGASPATSFTGLLTTASIGQAFWDNDHHLYAVGSGKLYVFTVGSFGVTQAPGSPHSIAGAAALIVLPRAASTTSVQGALMQGWQ